MEAKIKQILRSSACTYDESVKQVCDIIKAQEQQVITAVSDYLDAEPCGITDEHPAFKADLLVVITEAFNKAQ